MSPSRGLSAVLTVTLEVVVYELLLLLLLHSPCQLLSLHQLLRRSTLGECAGRRAPRLVLEAVGVAELGVDRVHAVGAGVGCGVGVVHALHGGVHERTVAVRLPGSRHAHARGVEASLLARHAQCAAARATRAVAEELQEALAEPAHNPQITQFRTQFTEHTALRQVTIETDCVSP